MEEGWRDGPPGASAPTGVDRTRPRNRGRLIAAPTGGARPFVSVVGAAAIGRPQTWRKAGETGRRGRRPLRDGAKNGRGAETAGGASPSPTGADEPRRGVGGTSSAPVCALGHLPLKGKASGTSRTPSPTGLDRTRPRNRGRLIAAPAGGAKPFVSVVGAAARGRPQTWRKAGETGRRGRRPLRGEIRVSP